MFIPILQRSVKCKEYTKLEQSYGSMLPMLGQGGISQAGDVSDLLKLTLKSVPGTLHLPVFYAASAVS